MPQTIVTSITSNQSLSTNTRTGFYISLPGAGFNLQEADTVSGFSLWVSEPSNTAIYYAFKTADTWFKLTEQGNTQNITAGDIDFASLKLGGNTTDELRALTNIPAFAGKSVMVAIGLEAQDITASQPAVHSMAVNYRAANQQTITERYSAVYELGDSGQVISCNADTKTTGYAGAKLTARITKKDGTLTDWLPLNQLAGQTAAKLQFKGTYSVGAVDGGTVQINHADLIYSDGTKAITGQVNTEIYSVSRDWNMDIQQVRFTVRHSHLQDSEISAYVCLRDAPVQVHGEVLGTGTGERRTYQLAHTEGIRYDSVRLYFDGTEIFSAHEVNTEVGRISCVVPEGVILTCDYEYGLEREQWQAMTLNKRKDFMNYQQSEYYIHVDGNPKTVCALKLVLSLSEGHIVGEVCGTATGKIQTVRLAHIVKDGAVKIFAGGNELSARNWEILNDPHYVRLSAPEGLKLTANYDWISDAPVVYQFAGVFAE